MREILWQLSSEEKKNTNIWNFMEFAGKRVGRSFTDYPTLHRWSVEEPEEFWGRSRIFSDPGSNGI
jgi:acetoacetyl-CoA synthetase